jgi:WD40 repeat protein
MTMGIRLRLMLVVLLVVGANAMTYAQPHFVLQHVLGNGKATGALWHPQQDVFAIVGDAGVTLYDVTLRSIVSLGGSNTTGIAWSADGNWLAVAEQDVVHVWYTQDITNPSFVATLLDATAPVAWSPDGEQLAYTAGKHVIRLWDRLTQRSTHVFDEHVVPSTDESYRPSPISEIAWSPDGTTIASVGSSQLIVWDAATGAVRHRIENYGSFVSVHLQWVGQQLWGHDPYAGDSGERYIIEGDRLTTEALNGTPPGFDRRYSPNGDLLVLVDLSQVVGLYRLVDDEFVPVAEQHFSGDDTLFSAESDAFTAWNAAGSYLVTGTMASVVLWRFDHDKLERIGMLTNYNGDLTSLDFSPDGSQLAAGYGVIGEFWQDGRLRVWDVNDGKLIWRTEWTYGGITSVEWHEHGALIATGHSESTCVVNIRNAQTHEAGACFISPFLGGQVRLRPSNNSVSTVSGGELFLFDSLVPPAGGETEAYALPDFDMGDSIGEFDWSPDGTAIVSNAYPGREASLSVWRVADGKLLAELENSDVFTRNMQGNYSPAHQVRFSPDGRWIAVAEGSLRGSSQSIYNTSIAIYDAATGKLQKTLKGHRRGIVALAWSPDSRQLLSGSLDGTARLWNLAQPDKSLLFSDPDLVVPVAGVAWSPVGDVIAIGMQSGSITLYKLA